MTPARVLMVTISMILATIFGMLLSIAFVTLANAEERRGLWSCIAEGRCPPNEHRPAGQDPRGHAPGCDEATNCDNDEQERTQWTTGSTPNATANPASPTEPQPRPKPRPDPFPSPKPEPEPEPGGKPMRPGHGHGDKQHEHSGPRGGKERSGSQGSGFPDHAKIGG